MGRKCVNEINSLRQIRTASEETMPAGQYIGGRIRMRFCFFIYFIAACCLLPLHGQQVLSVVSAANNQPIISPNSLATIYGANLAQGAASAQMDASGAYPTAIGGTSVSI